jgi:DNA-binding HxlR family transcriptional regulator
MTLSTAETMTFRGLKKTAITLLLLMRLQRPVRPAELARILDIQHRTASNHLKQLSAAGFVANTSSGYTLTHGGNQLLLPINARETRNPPEDKARSTRHPTGDNARETRNTQVVEARSTRHPSGDTSGVKARETRTPPINNINSESLKKNLNNKGVKDINNNNNKKARKTRTPEENRKIWSTLSGYGVDRNNRTRKLFDLDVLTPEYIDSHARQLEDQGKDLPRWAGLLVTRLETGKCPPGCQCPQCSVNNRMRYNLWMNDSQEES